MRLLTSIILFILSSSSSFSQTINDTVFRNIILIENNNVTSNGNDFLIDLLIKPQKKPLLILNNDRRIPTSLFFDRSTFLPEQDNIFLITPDWEFLDKIRKKEDNGKHLGLSIKAYRRKIYHIQRNNAGFKVDSLVLNDKVEFKFNKPILEADETKYDYFERYYSKCCPRDSRHSYFEHLQNSVKDFEANNNVSVIIKYFITGGEGEKDYYYQLENSTQTQKLQFFQIFKEADNIQQKIFTPIIRPLKIYL